MKARIGKAAAAVLAAAVLAACGSRFESVTVHRSGGIRGVDETYSLRKDGVGRIEKKREAETRTVKVDDEVLERLAAVADRLPDVEKAPAFQTGQGADFFSYELTLERKDAEPLIYAWDDGVRAADAVEESTLAALRDLSRAVIEEVGNAVER